MIARRALSAEMTMAKIYRCPKCDSRFDPPLHGESECPSCGIWFHKWQEEGEVPAAEVAQNTPDALADKGDPVVYGGHLLVLLLIAVWGVRLASYDYRTGEINESFMHSILLPIHEAGHVLMIPLGEFLAVFGGSLFQVALPLGIGAAFLLRQRDPFGAAVCLWWAGASLVDISPYIWDSINPQLLLLGGRTGEDGPHDWIYLLERLGILHRAHGLGIIVHHLGVLVMLAGVALCGRWAWLRKHWVLGGV